MIDQINKSNDMIVYDYYKIMASMYEYVAGKLSQKYKHCIKINLL